MKALSCDIQMYDLAQMMMMMAVMMMGNNDEK
jgi:hypothetical protein